MRMQNKNSLALTRFSFSPLSILATLVAILATTYVGLIALIMSYATLTVESSQSVKADEAAVAALEAEYLRLVSTLTTTDYAALGYEQPVAQTFVREVRGTALR